MTENTKSDIPQEEGVDVGDTDLDLPSLPGSWEWRTANHIGMSHKVNVHFGIDVTDPGGLMGEIDNYLADGEEVWDVHIREIVEAPSTKHGSLPKGAPDTSEQFDTLDAAIEAVPEQIATHHPH